MSEAASPERYLERQIRILRERRGLTAQQLTDQVAEHGGKLSRQAISKIENGDRRVTIDELLILSLALQVKPVELLVPDDMPADAPYQLTPTIAMRTAKAREWITGLSEEDRAMVDLTEAIARLDHIRRTNRAEQVVDPDGIGGFWAGDAYHRSDGQVITPGEGNPKGDKTSGRSNQES